MFRAVVAAVSLAAAAPCLAQERVPHINDEGQRSYRNYLNQGFHRVFAISENGGYGAGWGSSALDGAMKIAMENCQKRDAKGPCKPYSVNGYIAWGKDPNSLPRYAEAPKLGRFIPSDYTPVQGPQKAKGLVVWSHGYRRGVDATQGMPHPYVSRFLATGWDVYRFNREWAQTEADINDMVVAVDAAKAAGYKKIILVGQSHGAWSSLAALSKGVKADAVIATAPAKHGDPPSREARQDFRQLMRDVRSRGAADVPVVISLFEGDAFDPGGRFADVKDILGGSSVPLYFIEHPSELPGHGAGANEKFNNRFGPCILRFVTSAPPAPGDCK